MVLCKSGCPTIEALLFSEPILVDCEDATDVDIMLGVSEILVVFGVEGGALGILGVELVLGVE